MIFNNDILVLSTFIQYRYLYQIFWVVSHYVILLYPFISLVFILLSLERWAYFFFCSNALPIFFISFHVPNFTKQNACVCWDFSKGSCFSPRENFFFHSFIIEPSILCILTRGLHYYITILDTKANNNQAMLFFGICYRRRRCPALVAYTTGAGATARRAARSRRRCWPGGRRWQNLGVRK